jgi:FKBP-type peptidyl-prolyl cis-trans isomerase
MNYNTKRRIVSLLAVPALLFTGACGSDSSNKPPAAGVVEVKGKFGDKPEISVPTDAEPTDKTVVKTVSEGSGTEAKKGDFVRLDYTVRKWDDPADLGGTWAAQGGDTQPHRQAVERVGQQPQQLPQKVLDSVSGRKAGSRVLVQGTAGDLIGAGLNPQSGLTAQDYLVWVVDLAAVATVAPKAEVKGSQAAPEAGLPTVTAESQKAATIVIPKGAKAPAEMMEQVLIKGTGPKIEAGQGLIGQYTGVKWEDGQKFDSSWDHGGAIGFQLGTGSVVSGWDKGLVGKNVGDRVLLVIPPSLAYGADPSHELAKNTLVFVVDIVGAV